TVGFNQASTQATDRAIRAASQRRHHAVQVGRHRGLNSPEGRDNSETYFCDSTLDLHDDPAADAAVEQRARLGDRVVEADLFGDEVERAGVEVARQALPRLATA